MIKEDKKLHLSNENFQKIIEKGKYVLTNSDKLELQPYPADDVLAKYAHLAYEKYPYQLPPDWKFLVSAENGNNSYYGVAYINYKQQQVVIAHRGTKVNFGCLIADAGILLNKYHPQMNSAATFANKMKQTLGEFDAKNGTKFEISFTGHSLGGWLAQITTFTTKYLTIKDKQFVKKDSFDCHPHTLAIESPGCRQMLDKMATDFNRRYDEDLSYNDLDISVCLSAPNMINTFGLHVKGIYKIATDISNMTFFQKIVTYTFYTHKSAKIVEVFDSTDSPRKYAVKDWPSGTKEYSHFHSKTDHSSQYTIDPEAAKSSGVRYHTDVIAENMCNLRVFTEEETLFLKHWKMLKETGAALTILSQFIKDNDLGSIEDIMADFKFHQKNEIMCKNRDDLEKVVRHTKQLMRWFPGGITRAINLQMKELPSFWESMYQMESKSCLGSLFADQINFKDFKEVPTFLKSKENNILVITSKEIDLQMIRVHSTISRSKDKIGFYFTWQQILRLNETFDINNILTTQTNLEKLKELCVVVKYRNGEITREAKQLLINKYSSQNHLKLILVTDDHTLEIGTLLHVDQLKFDDLDEITQHNLLEEKIFFLHGNSLSLKDIDSQIRFQDDLLDKLMNAKILKDILGNGNFTTLTGDQMALSNWEVVHRRNLTASSTDSFLEFLLNNSDKILAETMFVAKNLDNLRTKISQTLTKESEKDTIENLIKSNFEENSENYYEICKDNPKKQVYLLDIQDHIEWIQHYNSEYYIDREFCNQNLIGHQIHRMLKTEQPDLLIFYNLSSKDDLCRILKIDMQTETDNWRVVTTEEEALKIFRAEENCGRPVHVIFVENHELFWKRSNGSLDGIRKYMHFDNTASITEENFIKSDQKVVIIADEPGMGKSTTLSSLCRKIDDAWVFTIDIKHFHQHLQNLPTTTGVDLETISKFLLHNSTDPLAEIILRHCLTSETSKPVRVLFDGFDELKEFPEENRMNKKRLIDFIKYLHHKTLAKTWITTRKYPSSVLENNLSTFAIKFKEISKENQISFFKKYWLSNPDILLQKTGDKDKQLEKYAEKLYEAAESFLGKDITSFLGMPLQLRMLAEVFQPELQSLDQEEISLKHLNILELYQSFLQVKYDIYLKEKSGISLLPNVFNVWIINKVSEKLQALSFQLLFPDEAEDFLEETPRTDGDEEEELNKVGLMHFDQEGQIQFIHRTFSEYFCASLIYSWLTKRHTRRPKLEELLLRKVLLQPQYGIVRLFLNQLLEKSPLDYKGFKTKVQELWEDRKEIFYDQNKDTVVHVAAREKLFGIIDMMSHCEVFINLLSCRNRNWNTPLNIAAKNEDAELISTILNKLKYYSSEDKIRVILASIFRKTDDFKCSEVKYLITYIENNKDVEKELKRIPNVTKKKLPIMRTFLEAALNGTVDNLTRILEEVDETWRPLLLSFGDDNKNTVLHFCARKGYLTATKLMYQYNPENDISDDDGKSPLHVAAEFNHPEIFYYLESKGCNIHLRNFHKMTTFAWAAKAGNNDLVKHLMEEGVDTAAPDVNGLNALLHASKGGHLETVELLLKNNFDIDYYDYYGMRALSRAARMGHLPTVKFLVENGAQMDIQDRHGATALLTAIKTTKWAVVKFLVENGANINLPDFSGVTPLKKCMKTGRKEMIAYLESKGAVEKAENTCPKDESFSYL